MVGRARIDLATPALSTLSHPRMHVRPLPHQKRSAPAGRNLALDAHRVRRIVLLAAIIAVHVLIIVWLMSQPPAERKSEAHGETLITISSSSGDRAATEPQKPAERPRVAVRAPLPPPLIPMPSLSAAAPDIAGAAGVQGGGSPCQLAADAALAIQHDPVAMAELAALPPGVRSEADAVMVWNGVWFDQAPAAAVSVGAVAPKGRLHLAIEEIVAAAPAQCRDEAMVGPVFVPVPEGERSIMLAIGSGMWRWSDLLPRTATCPAIDQSQCLEAPEVP